MSIEQMTHVSYFFIMLAVVFGASAIAMYFVLDIRRCWRILQGSHTVVLRNAAPYTVVSNPKKKDCEETKTVMLAAMDLMQDIVMTDAGLLPQVLDAQESLLYTEIITYGSEV